MAYGSVPYFEAGYALTEKLLRCPDKNLAVFLEHSMKTVADYLGINTPFIRSSALSGNNEYKKEYRIYDQCKRLGADTYINAIGGRELYDPAEFEKRGLKLGFLKCGDIQYEQFGNEFVPSLSILDVIMFNSRETIHDMLNQYELIFQ